MVLTELTSFLAKPFNPQGSAIQWFAFIGFLLIAIYLWHAIARDFSMLEREE